MIGIAGHVTGGGIGYLVRQFGLSSDSLRSVELVTADGSIIMANETTNPDLLWALKGAGQGSFGITTRMRFDTHDVPQVHTLSHKTVLATEQAAPFIAAWQNWIADAPKDVTSVVFVQKQHDGKLSLELKALIAGWGFLTRKGLQSLAPKARLNFQKMTLLQAFHWFSDGEYFPPTYDKGKSDIVKRSLTEDDWRFVLGALPPTIDLEITGLGGAMNEIPWDHTAFPHRGDSKLLLHWGISWDKPDQEEQRINEIRKYYAMLRPIMSGAAFLNYADRDIPNPAVAYWGRNLARLTMVKRKYDPTNVFQHALSVPLGPVGRPLDRPHCA
jgi:FAD/FMN-containing dehydrogenase